MMCKLQLSTLTIPSENGIKIYSDKKDLKNLLLLHTLSGNLECRKGISILMNIPE
jgi:hypothetical protein